MKNVFSKISQIRSWFSLHQMALFWYRFYRRIFWVFIFCISIFGIWYWYFNTHRYSWDEVTKKKFLESYAQETNFKESIFSKAVSSAQERQRRYESNITVKHDLFLLNQLQEETK